MDSPTDFIVDTRALAGTKRDGKILCVITNPSGSQTDSFVKHLTDGNYKISYTPLEEGNILALFCEIHENLNFTVNNFL